MNEENLNDDVFDSITLTEITCAHCSIRFGITKALEKIRREDHGVFYCPNGHTLGWPAPKRERDEELEDLRLKLIETKDKLAVAQSQLDQKQAGSKIFGRRKG